MTGHVSLYQYSSIWSQPEEGHLELIMQPNIDVLSRFSTGITEENLLPFQIVTLLKFFFFLLNLIHHDKAKVKQHRPVNLVKEDASLMPCILMQASVLLVF